jgi:hypothetical protein
MLATVERTSKVWLQVCLSSEAGQPAATQAIFQVQIPFYTQNHLSEGTDLASHSPSSALLLRQHVPLDPSFENDVHDRTQPIG